jgi:hypothetical protein
MTLITFRLICSSDRRMGVEQLKTHAFFYGVDWDMIRDIDSPFVPRLRSMTDTSYFPTDELQEVPDEPSGGDTTGANKDLAFLGSASTLSASTILPNPSVGTRSSASTTTRVECEGWIASVLLRVFGHWSLADLFLAVLLISCMNVEHYLCMSLKLT